MSQSSNNQPTMQICRCFISNDHGQILFIQRHRLSRYSPNLWEVPGGKSEEGENIQQTLMREIFEETNLVITIDDDLVHQESHIVPDGPRAGHLYRGLFATGRHSGGQLSLSSEHSQAVWLHLDQIHTIVDQLSPSVRRALDSLRTTG